ncbi:MAG TPA: mechanosensitive ion channel domain-containing protein [Armatimonadota bacterium]|jgi:small conductance mechanosensitive channel
MRWPFESSPKAVLEIVTGRGLHIFVVFVFAFVLNALLRRAILAGIERATGAADDAVRSARLRTLGGLASKASGLVIFFVASLMVLGEFGVDTKAVVTATGVFGVAIALGSQKLVRDVIGGFFILVENQFSVGETVTLGGPAATGVVEDMGLRVTRLRDDVGRLVIVGNADITSVTNHSRGPLTVVVDILLPEDVDVPARQAAMAKTVAALPQDDWAEAPRVLGLVDPPAGMVKIRVSGRAVPGRQNDAERQIRAALQGVKEA